MYACYAVFNEAPTLPESLRSVLPFVEKIVAVDGAWHGFPHTTPQSTDGTKEILERFCGSKLIWVPCASTWKCQTQKRSEYLKQVPDNKYFLVIDGDEAATGNLKKAFNEAESSRLNCLAVHVEGHIPLCKGVALGTLEGRPFIHGDIPLDQWNLISWKRTGGWGTRIYRKLPNMIYKRHHSTLWSGNLMVSKSQRNLDSLTLVNLEHKRSWQRWNQMRTYKRSMITKKVPQ